MKKLAFLFTLFSAALCAQTQNNADDYFAGTASKPKLLSAERVSASITAGAGISFLNTGKTSTYTTFIAPKVAYQLTNKFSLTLGMMHYSSTGNAFYPNGSEGCFGPTKRNITGNLVMVGGDYLLTKKLTISGVVMTDVNSFNKQNNFKAASLGLDYKLSNHSSIGIRATVSQGNQDYLFNPSRGTYDYNPMHNTFNGMFGSFGQWGTDALNGSMR